MFSAKSGTSRITWGAGQAASAAHPAQKSVTSDETKQLLDSNPAMAEVRARQALESNPANPDALFLLGSALRKQGREEAAKPILERLAASQPQMGAVLCELGLTLRKLGETDATIAVLLRTVDIDPINPNAWYVLGEMLKFPEPEDCADVKALSGEERAKRDRGVRDGEAALRDGHLDIAEPLLRERLEALPTDIVAMKLLADTLVRKGRWPESKRLFAQCLEIAPHFQAARFRYATMLFANKEFASAQPLIEDLLRFEPANTLYRDLHAIALARGRQFATAIAYYKTFIDDCGDRPGLWLEYAHALRAAGQHQECAAAFRKAIEILPGYVEAYWTLASVKSYQFSPGLVDGLRAQLARPDLTLENRAQLHFVLGKVLEDCCQYAESFDNYRKSNELLRVNIVYSAEAKSKYVQAAKAFFSSAFFRERANTGCDAPGPIFIVGMPRSGSTLIEQILSSHSLIEGLGELGDLGNLVDRQLDGQNVGGVVRRYPHVLKYVSTDTLRSLGEQYLERVRHRRKSERPYFTDKMPRNFAHTGLIHLLLPNAKIIDARRHPLDCGFSCYKHYFPGNQPFAHTLSDIGRSYVDYVELMAHFDDVLPGKVHRIIYEQLISDPEGEVRRLLDYLGLPFEERCMRFYENDRTVSTLSSEQVRTPLYKNALEYWRHYEPWLGPLKSALGPVLDAYPGIPNFHPGMRTAMHMPRQTA